MEEYLTVKELSSRIKFSKQSLYNIIHKGGFVLGKHYLKPTPKKIFFKWSEIQIWMGEISCLSTIETSESINQNENINNRSHIRPKSLIKYKNLLFHIPLFSDNISLGENQWKEVVMKGI